MFNIRIYQPVLQHFSLESLRDLLEQECGILQGFIGSLAELNHWKFAESLQKVKTYIMN